MKQRRINAALTITALALTAFLILTTLPRAGTAAPRLEGHPLESLTALNSTEATESGASLQRLQCSQRHQRFNPAGLAKFDEMVRRGELGVDCENERTRIYRVRG